MKTPRQADLETLMEWYEGLKASCPMLAGDQEILPQAFGVLGAVWSGFSP